MSKKSKTVIVLGSFNRSNGITTFVKRNYSWLKGHGWNFRFINIASADPARELSEIGPYREVSQLKLGVGRHISELRQAIREERAHGDYIHMHLDSLHNFLPLIFAKRAGFKRVIVHSHNDQRGQYGKAKELFQKIGMHLVGHCATDYLACSQFAGDFFYLPSIQQSSRFRVLVNGIPLEKFAYQADMEKIIRSAFNLGDSFVVGHVGRFLPQKNQQFLLQAFARFIPDHPDAKLMLIGAGRDMKKAEKLADRLRITDSVIFTGYVNNVSDLQNAFDVFALPSFYEGLSLSLLENQANGIPCLVSENQSPDSFIAHQTRKLSIAGEDAIERWRSALEQAYQEKQAGIISKDQLSWQNIETLKAHKMDADDTAEGLLKLYNSFK